MYQISRFTLTASICLLLLACVSTAEQPTGPLAGKKTIVLMGNKGEQLAIGTVLFTPTDDSDKVSYTIDIDYALFTDYFLSMKEMKCLEGPELWCHLRYPYEQPRTVTATDLSWLSHDLLFMFKKKGEFGANFWNGIYYEFDVRDDAIYGKAQAVDLNMLAAPPDDLAIPPFNEFERSETESAPRFLPFVEIRQYRHANYGQLWFSSWLLRIGMFVPAPFAFKEKTEQLAFIDEYAFAVLVSQNLQATHIPLLVRQDGDDLVLEGHVARGNPHWKKLDNTESLAIFAGPHAYISPDWYASSPNVPTWNYVAVHAKGQLNALDDAATLEVIDRIMDKFEPGMARPASGSAQADYQQKLLRGIVGIQLRVTSLEGVRKLGQHKSVADKAGVYNGLVNTGRHDALDLIDYMQRHQIACPEDQSGTLARLDSDYFASTFATFKISSAEGRTLKSGFTQLNST